MNHNSYKVGISMRKHDYLNLNMGIVKANFIIIKRRNKEIWKDRGFYARRSYPMFHNKLKLSETIMFGKPLNISQFGLINLKKSKITDISISCGTHGMGSPGFVGFKIEGYFGCRWLVYCIWAAGEHLLLNDRVLECNTNFARKYDPWIDPVNREESFGEMRNNLIGMSIYRIELGEEKINITLKDKNFNFYNIKTYKESDEFPEQGGTGIKRMSFENGKMEDYWLVIYDGTDLIV